MKIALFDQFCNYKENDFLYNLFYLCIPTKIIKKICPDEQLSKSNNIVNITNDFYDGFGSDLLWVKMNNTKFRLYFGNFNKQNLYQYLNFGFSKFFDPNHTMSKSIADTGTACYMTPEVIEGNRFNIKADV